MICDIIGDMIDTAEKMAADLSGLEPEEIRRLAIATFGPEAVAGLAVEELVTMLIAEEVSP